MTMPLLLALRVADPGARSSRLRQPCTPTVGIETLWRVVSPSGPVELAPLLPHLAPDVSRDDDDPTAVVLSCGVVLRADGKVAVLATGPLELSPDVADLATALLGSARAELQARLDAVAAGMRLEGVATHLAVGVDDDRIVDAARRFAETVGLAAILMTDGGSGPGVVVRARGDQLEVVCDVLSPSVLRTAIVFVLACARAIDDGVVLSRPRMRVVATADRFGFHVSRDAVGVDVLDRGRSTLLPMVGARPRGAGEHLADVWSRVMHYVTELRLDVESVDAVVLGDAPLPFEGQLDDDLSPDPAPWFWNSPSAAS